jgi:hypothetical protein
MEEKEISKGTLGYVLRCPKETKFTFFKLNIDKRKKLKEEIDALIKSYKEHQIKEGILKNKSIKTDKTSYTIITEPVIDSISNLHNTKLKGFEIFKIFEKFNIFIKYCLDKNINLSNLKLSDIYLTTNYEIKLLTINYDTEVYHKIKKEKFNDIHNNNILYIIGTIMYYLYYNEYPKKNETKFPEPKHFKELLKYCLNFSTKFDYNEYINHTFFHPDIIFPNSTKKNIISFDLYKCETNENYHEKKSFYKFKPYFDRILGIHRIKEININENLKIKNDKSGGAIYHSFFEEKIINFKDHILCITKKKDGTYLAGGYYNYIYQLYFDKYGLVEIISKVDSGYGYYEDDLSGDCIYSYSDSRYNGVGGIGECENGDIITISDFSKEKKVWKL